MNYYPSTIRPILLLFLTISMTHGGTRTSASYTFTTDTADAGGRRTTSSSYTNDCSIGGIAGISSVVAPVESAKHGYIGQLAEVAALQLAATPVTVNESATRQLAGVQLLDDLTTNILPAASVTWSVQSGPIASIDASGLVTAATVYQNTIAIVQGHYAGATGTLSLTVIDSIPDNFGSYAADGLDDAWQNQYFGLNNPNAAPLLDPDGDGQTNFFEFTAGLVPNDHASRFILSIEPVAGEAAQKKLIFSPLVAGRSYTVLATANLAAASYAPLTNASAPSDAGQQRTITDLSASEATKFYRVEITKP